MTQTSRISVVVKAEQTGTGDLAIPTSKLDYKSVVDLASGSGLGQASVMFSDQRTLTASSSEDLDLSGTLLDALGTVMALTKVKALIIKAAAANANDVVVGGAASNGCFAMFNASTDKLKIKPGGTLALIAPDAAGYAVTAATADLLKIANGGTGTSVTYDIIILGA